MCDSQIAQFPQKLLGYDMFLPVWLEQKFLHKRPTSLKLLTDDNEVTCKRTQMWDVTKKQLPRC